MMRHMRRVLTRAVADDEDVTRLRGLWSHLSGALERAERRRADPP
jgi:tRNA C32,U32 (ribose-2'-O)-methylase TrmJ